MLLPACYWLYFICLQQPTALLQLLTVIVLLLYMLLMNRYLHLRLRHYRRFTQFQLMTITASQVRLHGVKSREVRILHLRVNGVFALLHISASDMQVLCFVFAAHHQQLQYHKLRLMRLYAELGD